MTWPVIINISVKYTVGTILNISSNLDRVARVSYKLERVNNDIHNISENINQVNKPASPFNILTLNPIENAKKPAIKSAPKRKPTRLRLYVIPLTIV